MKPRLTVEFRDNHSAHTTRCRLTVRVEVHATTRDKAEAEARLKARKALEAR